MPADMKALIADAAVRLLTEKNVKKLTVKDIVEECHITRQTFYYHFEDIPHLLLWIMQRSIRQMQEEVRDKKTVEERLRYFFVMTLQIKPYIARTMATNYADELNRMLHDELSSMAEQIAENDRYFQDLNRSEQRIVLTYHSYGILGLLNEMNDPTQEELDRAVHMAYRIITGSLPLDEEAFLHSSAIDR